MGHKTLIGGTAYKIKGGRTLVNGTGYSITKGRTLVNGTGYDISFGLKPKCYIIWPSTLYQRSEIKFVYYADGYYVVGGQAYKTGNTTYYAVIAYSKNLDGPWTTKTLWSGTRSGNFVNCITYANGYWMVGGQFTDTTNRNNAYIAYATSLSGAWSSKRLWGTGSYGMVNGVAYDGEFWGAYGESYDNGGTWTVAYATSPDATWQTRNIYTGSAIDGITCAAYANRRMLIGGKYFNKNNNADYSLYVGHGSSADGSFSLPKIITTGDANDDITCINYNNGYYFAGVSIYQGTSTTRAVGIAYATNPLGTWTVKQLGNIYGIITGITYANGYWAVTFNDLTHSSSYENKVAYSTNIAGPYTIKNICISKPNYNISSNCILFANGYWFFGGSGNGGYARVAYAANLDQLGETS